ncbi:MAG: HipA domain-containing protein [Myxococcota bacterium]
MTESDPQTTPKETKREVLSNTKSSRPEGKWRFSLADIAMKFSMLKQGDRFTAPAAGADGDWIIKLPDSVYPQVPINEHAMMEFARSSGLDVPETRLVHRDELDDIPSGLWPANEDFAYAVKRFDRRSNGRRVHIEDFAQIRSIYPHEKYQGSFETIGSLVYRGRDASSLVEFAKRLAFIILIRNGDAHLKNWSLIYDNPRIPRLSPAYDMVATSIYRPLNQPEDLGLKFGKSRDFQTVSLSNFSRLQRKVRAADVDLASEVQGLVEQACSTWPKIADLLEEYALFLLLNDLKKELNARAAFLLRK